MFRKYQKNLIYLLVLVVPFFLFFIFSSSFSSLKYQILKMTAAPLQWTSLPALEVRKILYYHFTFDEYKRLKKENGVLKTRLIGFEEMVKENARLQKLLELKERFVFSSVVATVIGRDPSYWNSSFIINKGQQDGLKQGLPVVSEEGIIGKVSEVWRDKAKVILLTDPQFSVAALIQRTHEGGLLSGSLQGLCRMSFMDSQTQVQVGDRVITSKLSSSFPENLMIGQVVETYEDQAAGSTTCLVKPTVNLTQVEEVLVIIK